MQFGYRPFFIFSALIFFLSCWYFYPFISDDSLISLRYAQRFIEGKGISWNDGHPVEGYSNLLWILGISFLGKFGIDLILSARILGILCSLVTIWSILNYFRKQNVRKEYVFLAITLLVTTPGFAVWAIGGLEQPLYVLLVTLVIIEVLHITNNKNLKRAYYLSFWLGLLSITRPDGFLFSIVTASFLLFINRHQKSNLLKIAVFTITIPLLFLLSQLLFRYIYYSELVPNTALVKVKISFHHIIRGIYYHVKAFFGTLLISSLGFYSLFVLVFKKKNLPGIFIFLLLISWTEYISLVGGDIFPAFRHYAVVLIFLVFSIVLGLPDIKIIDFKNKKVLIGSALLLVLNFTIQMRFPQNQDAISERWEFHGMQLGKELKQSFPNKTLIAVTAAGCIPYASQLPSIDMLGLNDYYIPRHPPANFGNGSLAHELGDADYTMKRNPDIVIFYTGTPISYGDFNITSQLKKNNTFTENYVEVNAKTRETEHYIYINKYGENAGIKMNNNELRIPGYLFSNKKDSSSSFYNNNGLVKNILPTIVYEVSLKNTSEKKWEIKETDHYKKEDFKTNIKYENDQIKISISSSHNTLLDFLVLKESN